MGARSAKTERPRLLWNWRYDVLHSDLPPRARLLLLAIAHHLNDATEFCLLTPRQLTAETGMSAEHVTDALRVAVEHGLVEVLEVEHGQLCLTRVHRA